MSVSITSPVTGAAQTGFTSPTYTVSEQSSGPSAHSRQWIVTACGGTQSGVDAHSISNPFTVTLQSPATLKGVGQPNGVTGVLGQQPRNKYILRVRKGGVPLAGQAEQIVLAEVQYFVPAGVDSAEPNSIRAVNSILGGILSTDGDTISDSMVTGQF